MVTERPSAARFCFGCGEENPQGLHMSFRLEDGRAIAEFTATEQLQGFPGRVHGGGVATMLDEAMSWAVYQEGSWAMTARFSMRFRRPARLGEQVTVSGWVARDRGRMLECRAELRSADGALLAEAEGTFMRVDGERAEELRRVYEASIV